MSYVAMAYGVTFVIILWMFISSVVGWMRARPYMEED